MPTIASLIVRIGAQDQEIQNALARVGQKAKSVDADLKKLGNTPLAAQAQKSLDSLRATMQQVTDAQQRVADKARLAAQGLEAIGGASRLTDTQLKQVNRTLQEGLSAYQALGKEPPASLRRIAAETSKATTVTEGWKSSLKGLGAAIGAAFTVRAVINFGRDLLRMGDDIVRTSDRTGLLTDEVQRLTFIAKQSGNDLGELTGAVGQLQNRLASGDKSAVKAVKALGLSFEELRAAGPYEQLQLIADAVSKIEDPAGRAQVAMDLFGRTGIAILPTLTSKFKELGDAAPVMAHNTVLALDQAGDALEKFQLQVKVWTAESYNSLSGVFDKFSILVLKTTAAFFDATANILSVPLKIPGASTLFPGYQKSLDEVRERAQFARDAANQLGLGFNTVAAEARKAVPIFDALSEETKKVETAAEKAAKRYKEWLVELRDHNFMISKWQSTILATIPSLGTFNERIDLQTDLLENGVVALDLMKFHTDELGRVSQVGGQAIKGLGGMVKTFSTEAADAAMAAEALAAQLGNVVKVNLKEAFSKIPQILKDAFTGGGGLMGALKAIGVQMADALTAPFIARLSGLASKFAGVLTGGIGVGGAVAAGASSAIPTIAGTAINVGAGVGGAAAAGGGGAAATGVGIAGFTAATAAWTLGISAAVVGLYVGIKKLKEQKAHIEVNRLRDALGDFTKFNPAVKEITGSLEAVQAVFNARNPAQYAAALNNLNAILEIGRQRFADLQASVGVVTEKLGAITILTPELQSAFDHVFNQTTVEGHLQAVRDLNGELDRQAAKYNEIEATLQKYSIDFKNAGKEFQQAKINERALELRKDFDILKKTLPDINAGMRGMGQTIRDFVKDAKAFGVEVPESMREVIQVAIDAGEVFDENGKKITDINQLGLKFGTTMETAMKAVGTAVDRLTLVLEGLAKFLGITLPKAAQTGADKISDALEGIDDPVINVKIKIPDIPSGGYVPEIQGAATGAKVKPWGLQHFAKGTDTIPAMLTPGEMVLNAAQQKAIGNALSAGSVVVHLTMHVDGVFSEGDLVQTVQRRMVPIFQEVWENNVRGERTRSQDALGIKPV